MNTNNINPNRAKNQAHASTVQNIAQSYQFEQLAGVIHAWVAASQVDEIYSPYNT